MSGKKPREIALDVLLQRADGSFVEARLQDALARDPLLQADRRLCQELVYGIVRWQATLDWLIDRKTKNRLAGGRLRNLLRLGLYQIFWLTRIPPHAAVHQTVELAKQGGSRSQPAMVNAILRGYLREQRPTVRLLAELKVKQPAVGYSHPAWLARRWQQRWEPDKAAELMDWNNRPPRTFARLNTLKAEPQQLLSRWREEGVNSEPVQRDWFAEDLVFELKSHPSLEALPSFQQGWFYVQDPSTLLAAEVLAPLPGQAVLDFCAAPGGKLTHLAQLMRNQGRLVAHDTTQERLQLLEQNCTRLGVTCVQTVPPPTFGRVDSPFDRILVDVPCSNTGVMRRRVELRWRITSKEIQRLRTAQLILLEQSSQLLKRGGTLVYSTCSLEPEENADVVGEFLTDHREYTLEYTRELLPFVDRVDGAFVARLRRAG